MYVYDVFFVNIFKQIYFYYSNYFYSILHTLFTFTSTCLFRVFSPVLQRCNRHFETFPRAFDQATSLTMVFEGGLFVNSIVERDLIAPNYVSRNRISDDSATLAYRFPVRWLVRLISLDRQLTRGMIIKICCRIAILYTDFGRDTNGTGWSKEKRRRRSVVL